MKPITIHPFFIYIDTKTISNALQYRDFQSNKTNAYGKQIRHYVVLFVHKNTHETDRHYAKQTRMIKMLP